MNYLGSINTSLGGIAKAKSPVMRLSPKPRVVLGGIPKKKMLTLIEKVFNASGTFIVPSDAINNEFYVGCTGGGGGGQEQYMLGGGGAGRVSAKLTLTPKTAIPVTVGLGGIHAPSGASSGGTSSFGALISCVGGNVNGGVSGGGNGSYFYSLGNNGSATPSNCSDMFTVNPLAINKTNNFFKAQSFAGSAGGGGCYGVGATSGVSVLPNTGAGGDPGDGDTVPSTNGASGKVVIYYYKYV